MFRSNRKPAAAPICPKVLLPVLFPPAARQTPHNISTTVAAGYCESNEEHRAHRQKPCPVAKDIAVRPKSKCQILRRRIRRPDGESYPVASHNRPGTVPRRRIPLHIG